MSLLLRTSDEKHDAPAAEATPTAGPEAPGAAPDVRTCPTCQAPLETDQDWCLQCGAAQSRLGGRLPGMRAAGTVVALTTVLVGGAVAASYAALQKDPAAPAAGTTTQLAQAPQPAPATPPASTPTPTPIDPVPTTPATTETPIPDDTPRVPSAGPAPRTPSPGSTGGSSSSSSSSSRSSDSGSGTSTGDSASSSGKGTTTTPDPGPQPIALDSGAGSLYDPYTRDTAAGDAGKAFDDNPTTSFPITVAAGSPKIGAGLAVDLGKKRGIRELDLTLKTPGVGLEVYATDETDLPPDVLDSRWAHLRSLASAGSPADGHQKVTLGAGTTKYRHILLWFTTPPKSGTTVRVTELQILG